MMRLMYNATEQSKLQRATAKGHSLEKRMNLISAKPIQKGDLTVGCWHWCLYAGLLLKVDKNHALV